jgi:hypothetical protein
MLLQKPDAALAAHVDFKDSLSAVAIVDDRHIAELDAT